MFIMKAAGVLDIPWVAPNELHVTGQCDTQHGVMKGETHTHTHTTSSFITMHSSDNLDFGSEGVGFQRLPP